MKKGMKLLMILTALFSILYLSACTSEAQVPGFDVSVRPSDSTNNDTSSSDTTSQSDSNNNTNSSGGNSNNGSSGNGSSNNNSSNTLALLTPPGSTVTQSSEGAAVIQSDKNLQELIDFYQTALKELGATKSSSNQFGNTWQYTGTYNNGADISINIIGPSIQLSY